MTSSRFIRNYSDELFQSQIRVKSHLIYYSVLHLRQYYFCFTITRIGYSVVISFSVLVLLYFLRTVLYSYLGESLFLLQKSDASLSYVLQLFIYSIKFLYQIYQKTDTYPQIYNKQTVNRLVKIRLIITLNISRINFKFNYYFSSHPINQIIMTSYNANILVPMILLFQVYFVSTHTDQNRVQYFKGVKNCTWTLISQQKRVYPAIKEDQFFSMGKGQCEMNFIDNSSTGRLGNSPKSKLILAFFRPKYRDIRMAKMQIPLIYIQERYLEDGLKRNLSFKATDIETDYSQMQSLQIVKKNVIIVSYEIQNKIAVIKFNSLEIKIQFQDKDSSLLLPVFFIVYNLLLLFLSHVVKSKKIIPQKISLLSLYHSVTFMLFLSVLQLLVGIAELPSFHSWFILSGILTVVLAIRMIQAFQEAVQRMIGIQGYLIFYISLFSYLWLLLNYGNRNWLLILNSLSLIPQILHNVRFGNRLGLHFSYIAIIISNQMYVLYAKGYSDNILRYYPDQNFCQLILLLAIAQVVFITLQNILGPLFFIPKIFIPGYHNYFDMIHVGTENDQGQSQCPICLCPLGQNPQNLVKINHPANTDLKSSESQTNIASKQKQVHKKIIMRTPCGHNFHRQCLSDWMEYKLECPVDRSPIPPVM